MYDWNILTTHDAKKDITNLSLLLKLQGKSGVCVTFKIK